MKKKMKALKPSLTASFKGPSFGLDRLGLDEMNLDKDLLNDSGDIIMDENSVDSKPSVVSRSAIEFPQSAIDANIMNGYVELRILIGKDGKVTSSEILESKPKGIFDEVALASVQMWKFNPATYRGKNVSIWAKQVVKFGE